MAALFYIEFTNICFLYVAFMAADCVVFDMNTPPMIGPVTAIVETKKLSTSIRLQRATPRDLYIKFSSSRKGDFKNLDLDGTPRSTARNEYIGLTFDYHRNMYYVINRRRNGEATILGFYASGINPEPIQLYTGLSSTVRSIAMDWVNGVLYWADPTAKVIMKTPVEPKCLAQDSARAIIGGLSYPIGVAVYPDKGYVYWTDAGSNRRIERSDLDGKYRRQIITNVRNPRAITIDYDKDRIYWIDNRDYNCILESADLDGNGRRLLVNVMDSNLFDLDILQDYIIATDVKKSRVYLYSLAHRRLIWKDWIGKPLGVKVYSQQRQTASHLSKPENVTELQFSMDKGTVFLGSAQGIYRMDRNYPDQKSKERISPFLLRNMTTALTSDAHSKFLYFYEDELQTIQRIKLNIFSGVAENWTTSELVTLAVGKVEGLAVDWVAGNLYWSDSRFQQIMVSKEDGRYPFTLISEAVSKPRSLVVHPTKRFVFWCDVDEDMPRIERCGLDGSRRQSIVTGNKARAPRALAIDFKDDRLYWTDGIIIHYGKLNGTGQFCLHSSGRSAVRSLIIFNNYIMWSDVVGRLHTAHKEYSKGQEQMDGGIAFFVDLVYHDESCQPMTTNPCAINNGNCDHLCLPNDTGYRCVCALGYWNFNGRCISGVGEERFLIFADQRQAGIYQRPLFLDEYYSIPLQNIKQPRDVVYDGVKKLIYWSDIALSTISRSKINGSNQEIIFYHARMMPYTLSIDAKSQLLYFVDISRYIVVVINLKNYLYYTVINKSIKMIQDVALDPTRGMMYISCRHEMVFADNSTHDVGAVYSATMTGDMVKPMVVGLGNPKGITMHGDEVIWVDPQRKAIEGISTTNGTKYTLKRFLKTTDLHDITVAAGYIYWTELEARAIKRSPFNNLTQTEIYGQEKFYRVPGLDSFTKQTLNETVCSIQDRDTCRFMCIPSPKGGRCICPDSTRYNRGRCRRRFHINYKKTKFCFTPHVENGKLVGNEPDVYVPIGYRLQFSCNPGYRVEWRKTIQNNKNGYILCNIGGSWNRKPACLWALPYTVHGDNRYGYAILHESTQFLVPSMVHLVNVICIAGGGGGFDSNNKEFKNIEKAGDGQNSKFGDVLISMGGEGGSLSTGGKGGIGTVLFGGNGGDTNLCHHGGAAGQMTEPRTCYQPSTFCTFCGAGGRKSSCPLCSGKVTGGCSGPLSPSDGSTEGSHYGGGASGGSGGGGGGAGFSRMNVDVTPGEMVTVVVGKGGAPSFAPPGDGIVVICWGGTIEDFLEVNVYDSLVKNILC